MQISKLFLFAFFLGPSVVSAQVSQPVAELRWKNGDALPGRLLEGSADQIRWSSPIFSEALTFDTKVLRSIHFAGKRGLALAVQEGEAEESFRIGTATGDVFVADIVSADASSFLFSSQRFGQVRVGRDAVDSLARRTHPNLIHDGSRFRESEGQLGPIQDLSYKVYEEEWDWEEKDLPDFPNLTPVRSGRLAAGFLDLELAESKGTFAMEFEGRLEIAKEGTYRFYVEADDQARIFVDGKLVAEYTGSSREPMGAVRLTEGSHALRVEFQELGGAFRLHVDMYEPNGRMQKLVGKNRKPDWTRGSGGHPATHRQSASVFHAVDLPRRFEVNLELASTESPRFVLAFGKDAEKALRLETWDDELVVVQNDIFEPVLTIREKQRDVRLRLAVDMEARILEVFDRAGRRLAKVEGVEPVESAPGIFLRNRGSHLMIRRLIVYRQPTKASPESVDFSKPRVHLLDGTVVYGTLFVEGGRASVVDATGTQQEVDLAGVDRIANPNVQRSSISNGAGSAELGYADGAIVRGCAERLSPERVTLRTEFADAPVACSLQGASILRWGPESASSRPARGDDVLSFEARSLRGRLSFGTAGAPLRWEAEGSAKTVPLAITGSARVERSDVVVSKREIVDEPESLPHRIYLKNGEVIPCRVEAYDEHGLSFASPFIAKGKIEVSHVKAVQFVDDLPRLGKERLKRALTVPRFNRDSPQSHVLVARTGDLKRGSLIGFSDESLRFESKLRDLTVPVGRLACVIDVSKPDEDAPAPVSPAESPKGQVRALVTDGSIWLFEPLESKDGKLLGRSSIYGELAIPIDGIRTLILGAEDQTDAPTFADWVVRPALEPQYGKKP